MTTPAKTHRPQVGKTILTERVAAATGISEKDTGVVITAFLDEIARVLAGSGTADTLVTLTRFGTFSTRYAQPRAARNPQDGTLMTIPAGYRVSFHAHDALRHAVRGRDISITTRKSVTRAKKA